MAKLTENTLRSLVQDAIKQYREEKENTSDDNEKGADAGADPHKLDRRRIAWDNLSNKQREYQALFKDGLKKFDVSSPAELSDEEKVEFFNWLDKNWESEDEKDEANEAVSKSQIKKIVREELESMLRNLR